MTKDEKIKKLEKLVKEQNRMFNRVNASFLDIICNREDFNKVVNEILLQVKPIKLRTQIASDFFLLIASKEQNLSHEICKKIREEVLHWAYTGNPELLRKQKLLEILDQIEKEKEKE